MRALIIPFFFALLILLVALTITWPGFKWLLVVYITLGILGFYDFFQSGHSIWRNFPIIGRGRWLMEYLGPYIRQYFIENDTDGVPISRMFRSVIYQRAKGARDTVPFGTRIETSRVGYEWIGHSISALDVSELDTDLRVTVGGPSCKQPYNASIFNISAMSFGALSRNAILALSKGAKAGNFYHNTGEGGISPYHLEGGGDLVWQLGTGYFGCRDQHGNFDAGEFRQKALLDTVKMIEIKLSQGAKPGHGGILPAEKNTPEIADIRGVQPGTQVDSPSSHTAFNSPRGLVQFIEQLRQLSDGKPIGFKLAIGRQSEFVAICKAMVELQCYPDFITVDGGEGGTGAAPLEYSNSIGMPLREALAFVDDCLTGFGLRRHIRIIASAKIFTGFHIVKHMALGADICNSARGMMLSLGCVQSLTCNTNHCPTGVATQNPKLYRGLVVSDKFLRVKNFHQKTVFATAEIISSAGLKHTSELNRTHIFRRVSELSIQRYDEVFPYLNENVLQSDAIPKRFQLVMSEACADSFLPDSCMTSIESSQHRVADKNQVIPTKEVPA